MIRDTGQEWTISQTRVVLIVGWIGLVIWTVGLAARIITSVLDAINVQ